MTSTTALKEAPPRTALFEGQKSLSGKIWYHSNHHMREALGLAQSAGISELVAGILLKRGISYQEINAFLRPTLRDLMPDPSHLKDLDKAVDHLTKALKAGEKIAVFGDYDVDGATASALLKRYFRDLGTEITVYIPQRIEEGYGPNVPALQQLKDEGHKIIIMVDCGTTAFEPLSAAREMGLEVIVIDHHMSEPSLPEATAIINPNRLDENSPLTHLCAAGLTFTFLVALHRALRLQGWFADRPEPDLRQYLDLVALGTVCDVMPLTGLNRAFVSQGLKVMARRSNLGLRALADIAALDEMPSAYHLGFLLGPRINAGGRVGRADYGTRLLSTLDPLEASQLAKELDMHNKERQEIEMQVLEQAQAQVERLNLDRHPVILVGDDNWHPGVIGIAAGRLKERYNRPVCVVGFDGGMGKGSGRSINGVNLGAAMHAACQKGLLVHGGGHAMAAGFSVARDTYDAFYAFLIETLGDQVAAIEPSMEIDGVLTPSGATLDLIDELKALEPFGNGNPTPRFCIHKARVSYAEKVGVNHIRCQLHSEDGSRLKAMAFRAADTDLGNFILSRNGKYVEVAGTLKADTWNGRRDVTLFIDDAMGG